MAKYDLDDRAVAESKGRKRFVPRHPAKYRIKVTGYREFETNDNDGYEIEFVIEKATSRQETIAPADRHYLEPLALEGETYIHWFKNKAPYPDEITKAKRAHRLFLAAAAGKKHTPEFKANKVLAALFKIGEDPDALEERLDPIELTIETWLGKPKTNEETGETRRFVNTEVIFSAIDPQ